MITPPVKMPELIDALKQVDPGVDCDVVGPGEVAGLREGPGDGLVWLGCSDPMTM